MSSTVTSRDAENTGPVLDAEILTRVLGLDRPECRPEVAEWILSWKFPAADEERMSVLSEKARQGTLTPVEEQEINGYVRVSDFVSLMQSKARLSLKMAKGVNEEFRKAAEYVLEKNRELYRRLASSD